MFKESYASHFLKVIFTNGCFRSTQLQNERLQWGAKQAFYPHRSIPNPSADSAQGCIRSS